MTWNQIGIILLTVAGFAAMWEEWKFFRRQDREAAASRKRIRCFENWTAIVKQDTKKIPQCKR